MKGMSTMKSLGVCIGASSIKVAIVDEAGKLVLKKSIPHDCQPKQVLDDLFHSMNFAECEYAAVTGRKFKKLLNLSEITEPIALECALQHIDAPPCRAVISLGAENFMLYSLNKKKHVVGIQTGNKCASGTGEFFLQQIRRMNVDVSEAISLAHDSEPYTVSGRCSVFCKSDCTHALNKGIPKGRVAAGLSQMIADKAIELLKSIDKKDIMIVGGVTRNDYVVQALRKRIDGLMIPEYADIFEAYGAAVYAQEKKLVTPQVLEFQSENNSFSYLPPLSESRKFVTFKDGMRGKPRPDTEYILGLDVGSTTTKAVLLDTGNGQIAASSYLRTNGNPISASRSCYADIGRQITDVIGDRYTIVGLGVTGSGRKIAGLHAMTDGIVNEIIAHATGAANFDAEVDTIFEIGGQDAKYTHLVNGVPCDYAMNEACSAGTGSFLEEAAKESLGISYQDIEGIALTAQKPPNFNDQCAAFISSDIKNASHENIDSEDIVAGLVYSICTNYINRVKGNRRVGRKVFMQGGVCYNKAVPLAMAQLLRKEIIVPPEPGLMGAFGTALEVRDRIKNRLLNKQHFDLDVLAAKEVEYGKSFICQGKSEGCDRGCSINIIKIDSRKFPFGGACNKYYNQMHHLNIDPVPLDYVARRGGLLFQRDAISDSTETVGIPRSLYVNILFPLYYHFFTALNLKVVLSDSSDPEGVRKTASAFCFPVEIAHGMYQDLLNKQPKHIFLPHIKRLHVPHRDTEKDGGNNCTCVLAQCEPYYLKSAFKDIPAQPISPVLDFHSGYEAMEEEFVKVGQQLGCSKEDSLKAFAIGAAKQRAFLSEKKRLGQEALRALSENPAEIAVVVFGRPYNALSEDANLGIPRKLASRNVRVIPFDCLPYENESSMENMNWAIGHELVQAARFVKKHPQLYGAYISNFSCGPDSFILGYFRDIMKTKPSLTLELDSHSADAGINTRIEAFLDIVQRYRKLRQGDGKDAPFHQAELRRENNRVYYITSDETRVPIKSPRVKIDYSFHGAICL